MSNKRGDITPDLAKLKKGYKGCCTQLYAYKLDSLDETHIFLDRHKLLTLSQGHT